MTKTDRICFSLRTENIEGSDLQRDPRELKKKGRMNEAKE